MPFLVATVFIKRQTLSGTIIVFRFSIFLCMYLLYIIMCAFAILHINYLSSLLLFPPFPPPPSQ